MDITDIIRTLLTGAVLFAFIVIFAQETLAIWGTADPPQNEARTYVWTGISALLGSVTALLLGVQLPKESTLAYVSAPDVWRTTYAVIYVVVGLVAVVTWVMRTARTTVLMKNLAATFLGLALPVVSGWLLKTVSHG